MFGELGHHSFWDYVLVLQFTHERQVTSRGIERALVVAADIIEIYDSLFPYLFNNSLQIPAITIACEVIVVHG